MERPAEEGNSPVRESRAPAHAGARVLDFNAQPAAVAVRFPADLYFHPSALCVLHRVGGQIVQYPGYANAVSMERPGNIR